MILKKLIIKKQNIINTLSSLNKIKDNIMLSIYDYLLYKKLFKFIDYIQDVKHYKFIIIFLILNIIINLMLIPTGYDLYLKIRLLKSLYFSMAILFIILIYYKYKFITLIDYIDYQLTAIFVLYWLNAGLYDINSIFLKIYVLLFALLFNKRVKESFLKNFLDKNKINILFVLILWTLILNYLEIENNNLILFLLAFNGFPFKSTFVLYLKSHHAVAIVAMGSSYFVLFKNF